MKGMKAGGHMRGGGHMKGMPGMGHMKGMPGAGHMKGMKGWQRFGRGHIVPPHFRNRQFFVHNWQSFGWPAPMPGGQWIRYYDDALLIDGHGRVMDSRYGWDWDRRGGYRAYDDRGHDESYDEDYAGHDDYGRDDHGYEDDWGDCRSDCGPVRHVPPPPPHPGYGHGYGSGYSYGYGAGCACGPVVVTETITTTAPVMETHTYYETVTEHRAAPRRHYRKPAVRHYSKPVVRRSVKPAYRAPAPRPGERG
jgi:Ni/Co efflux regulator RcnB